MSKRQVYWISVVLMLLMVQLGLSANPDPIGHWKFDDGAGLTAADSSGGGYDGTLENAGGMDWVAGVLRGALTLDGTGYVSVPAEVWTPVNTQLTIAVWAFGSEGLPNNWFFFAGDASEQRLVGSHLPWDGTVYFDTTLGWERINKAAQPDALQGQWRHWTFVKNADTGDKKIYLDGELWHSGSGFTTPVEGVAVFRIGAGDNGALPYSGLIDDFQLYDVELTQDQIRAAMQGISAEQAVDPMPEDGQIDVPRDIVLNWTAGEFAATHDVYLGVVFDDVNDASRMEPRDVLVSQGQTGTTYAPPIRLDFGRTYYWRVDEVNAAPDSTIFKGETWSFTVEPLAYPVEAVIATSNGVSEEGVGPENMVNGSGLNAVDQHSTGANDMWLTSPAGGEPLYIQFAFDRVYKLHEMLVWNYNVQFELMLGFGIKDVAIEYSDDGANWTMLGDVMFNQATASSTYIANTTVDFGGVGAQYVRIHVNSGYGPMGQFGLSEVRFTYIPVQAREPQPKDGAVDVAVGADLSWRGGREAVSSEVYLSTDPNALELIGTVAAATVHPGVLDLAATYYWRVDEVNEAEAIRAWIGEIWSFSTQEFIVVDDFEGYTDDIDAGTTIFDTWLDGWVNETGSTVGYLQAPFAEQTIVHNGSQSMPLSYDNAGGITVSETERTFDVPMDWTAHGIKSLSLTFAGAADSVPGQLYLKVNGTKVLYDGAAADLQVSGWLAWTVDVSALGNVDNVTSLAIGVEGAGAEGVLYVDDIRLYPQEAELIEPVEPDPTGLVARYELDNDFRDSSGNGNHAQAVGDAAIASDPVRGNVATLDGLGDAIVVPVIGDGTTAEMTISMWARTEVAWTGGFFALYHNNGWDAGDIHMHVSNGGYFSAGVNGLAGGDLQGTTLMAVDQWYNVTVTVSASEANLYVNGVRESSRVPTAIPESFTLGEGHLGAWLNGANLERALTGQIDDVHIYNRVLSYAEVMSLASRTTSLYKPF